MRETLRSLSASLATFLAPGLLLLLIGIQIAFGLRGFDRPDGSLLYVLQVPGVLLGWGGVAALAPLLVWMILDWWGYDLNGFALRGLGSAVLGIAVGTMVGLSGGEASGGIVGGGLASILSSTVGGAVSIIVLLLMAIPGGVLAFSLQRTTHAATATEEPRSKDAGPSGPVPAGWLSRVLTLLTPGGYGASKGGETPWYPEPRFDAAGDELPMDLGPARDVGGIRFVDEEDEDAETAVASVAEAEDVETAVASVAEATAPAPVGDATESEERLPTIPELLAGAFDLAPAASIKDPSGGVLEPGDARSEEGPVHIGGDGRPVQSLTPPFLRAPAAPTPPPVVPVEAPPAPNAIADALADEVADEVAEAIIDAAPDEVADAPSDFTGTFPFLRSDAPAVRSADRDDEANLQPGVRYAPLPPEPPSEAPAAPDPEAADTPSEPGSNKAEDDKTEDDEPPPKLSPSLESAVRGPPTPPRDPSHAAAARSIRSSLRRSVAALQNEGPSERHLAKLDAIGMFDAFEGPTSDDPSASAVKQARPKKATKPKVAKKDTASPRRPAVKNAPAKPAAAARKTPTRKAPTRKTPTRKTPTRKAPSGRSADVTSGRKAAGKQAPGQKKSTPRASTRSTSAEAKIAAAARAARDLESKALLEALRIERLDPLFRRAVEAGLEHGAISSSLLTRRLGLPYARTTTLLERLVASGVVEAEQTAGAHPLTISAGDWAALDQ